MNLEQHLEFRRASFGNINNTKLLGLAAVEINLTELCNRTCSFCPRHDPKLYQNLNTHIALETVQTLVSQLQANSFTGYIILSGFSEPTLHPNILQIINILSVFTVEMITNGDTILSNKYSIFNFFNAGLTRLIINDYDNNPNIQKLAATNIHIRDNYDNGQDNFETYGFNNRGGLLWSETRINPCYIPAYRAIIDSNGDVLLCYNDWKKSKRFGNILKQDLNYIWMSDEFTAIRKQLILGNRNVSDSCKNCSVVGTLMGKQYADLWINTSEA
jgi:radical SAM protein with 4Fe4S-binding SPASM domain